MIKFKTLEDVTLFIDKVNIKLGYPNEENGTLTYANVPELTEIKDNNDIVIESYYGIVVTPELNILLIDEAVKSITNETDTPMV